MNFEMNPAALPLYIYLHLPKTGGRTLATILQREYGQIGVLDLYDSTNGEEINRLSNRQLEHTRLVLGHFHYGLHAFINKPAVYLTLLRDPVDRVISHYYFVQRDPNHYLYPLAVSVTLEEYVIECGAAEPNNDQTRLLAGPDAAEAGGLCTPEMLSAARHNLHQAFFIAGLTEEFDRTILLLKSIMGWRGQPYYVRHNVSRRHPGKDEIDPQTLRVIEDYNRLDMELYQDVKVLFQQHLSRNKQAIERELVFFQKTNALYGRLYNCISLLGKMRNSPKSKLSDITG